MNNSNIKINAASNQKEKYQFSSDMVKTYLREIGRTALLTIEQEIFYAKQVQQMMLLLEAKEKLELEC
jgi:RNA polymerase nonessential primary-like sigma factor